MKTKNNSMKYHFLSLLISVIMPALITGGCSSDDREINIENLLGEMSDRVSTARWPEPEYRQMQASSYNRESVSPDKPGWFADSDGVFCIRTEEKNGRKEWVLMEDTGPGCLTRIWAVCFYYGLNNITGANVKIYLDGAEEPVINTNFFNLVKGRDFIKPPFADSTVRAGVMVFPIPFAKSCKVTMDDKVFYNIISWRKYPEGTKVKTFTMEDYEKAGRMMGKTAETLLTTPSFKGKEFTRKDLIPPGKEISLEFSGGNASVRQIEIKLKQDGNYADVLRSLILTGEFDGEQTIWAPVGDFFSNVSRLKTYRMWERTVEEDGTMICRWVMPYSYSCKLALKNIGKYSTNAEIKVTTGPWKWDERSMHFHATWRMDDPYPTFPIFDWNFLEAEGRGVIVGDEWTVLNPAEGWWGEGDEKIYVDDDFDRNFPSHFGTGTEDYYGWAGGIVPTPRDEFSKPFHANVLVGDPNSMGYNICTRTRTLDAIPFRERIKFDMEASCGTRSSSFFLQYAQTTYWYAFPGVRHNRQPLPAMVVGSLRSVEDLQAMIREARKNQYVAEGAIEAEILPLVARSSGVTENAGKLDIWGEVSSGKMKSLWFRELGDYAEIRLTEQFSSASLSLCAAVGQHSGIFDIYVNGEKKLTQDFWSGHAGMTNPLINLGEIQPENNAFTIRVVFREKSPNAPGKRDRYGLGIDYFIIK